VTHTISPEEEELGGFHLVKIVTKDGQVDLSGVLKQT
jgi:hypothetical protein